MFKPLYSKALTYKNTSIKKPKYTRVCSQSLPCPTTLTFFPNEISMFNTISAFHLSGTSFFINF